MNHTYLLRANLKSAIEVPRETVVFLVENGYAVFDRTMQEFQVDYYRPTTHEGCTYDCSYCNPDDEEE